MQGKVPWRIRQHSAKLRKIRVCSPWHELVYCTARIVGRFLTLHAHIVLLISLNRVHFVSICLTVSSPLLHSHLASLTSGILRLWGNFRGPIFPGLIWTINKLTYFNNLLCMCSTFLVDEGAISKSARPFVSFCHSSSYLSYSNLVKWAFPALFRKGNSISGAAWLVSILQSFPFLFFTFCYPVASLAATSVSLFPSISLWIETQWSFRSILFLRSMLIEPMINCNICCPGWLSGFSVDRMALWLLIKNLVWLIYESVSWDRIILRASAIPCSSFE